MTDIFMMPYLKMFLGAHVYLYGQNRLKMTLHVLNKICKFEFAKRIQKVTAKQGLPPCPNSPQMTVGLLGAILTFSTHTLP